MFQQEVGNRIRKAREAANMTQAELAAHIGVWQSKIVAYEAGTVDISLDRFCLIAQALNKLPSELLENL